MGLLPLPRWLRREEIPDKQFAAQRQLARRVERWAEKRYQHVEYGGFSQPAWAEFLGQLADDRLRLDRWRTHITWSSERELLLERPRTDVDWQVPVEELTLFDEMLRQTMERLGIPGRVAQG